MNRKEAKTRLQILLSNRCDTCRYGIGKCTKDCEFRQAVDMAIESLLVESSDDTISRADALEQMAQAECGLHYEDCKADDCSCDYIWRILNLPSADSKTNEWIPVSEGLPKEHEWIGTKEFGTTISDEVLITFDVNGTRFVKPLSLQNGKLSMSDAQTMDVFYKGWKMLAWMPKPKPYREDDEA